MDLEQLLEHAGVDLRERLRARRHRRTLASQTESTPILHVQPIECQLKGTANMRRFILLCSAVICLLGVVLANPVQALSEADTEPPNVLSFDFTPKTVDTASSSQTITFTARFTDNLSGVWGGFNGQGGTSTQAAFNSPSGNQTAWVGFSSSQNLVSGTPLDGIYSSQMTIPRYSEAGVWKIDHLLLADEVQNFKTLQIADLEALGFPTEFTVVDTGHKIFLPFILRGSQ